jgi:SAM-dependent methyltransferase
LRRPAPAQETVVEHVRAFYEAQQDGAGAVPRWRRYFHEYLARILRARITPGQRVLDVGCGAGDLLAAVQPARGVGLDLAGSAIASARAKHPSPALTFHQGDGADPDLLARLGGPFDAVLMVNVVTGLADVQAAFEAVGTVCHPRTRLFVFSYSRLWQPLVRAAEMAGLMPRPPAEAWLPPEEVRNMLQLADYEVVRRDYHVVMPVYVPLLSELLNRYLGRLPGVELLSLMYGLVARPSPHRFAPSRPPTVSVVIPCRNEAGHIDPLVRRLPATLAGGGEYLFVEGGSKDDTEGEIKKAIAAHPERRMRLLKQTGKGKGDAVRLGFAEATGDVLAILDSDMGVAPEDLDRFVDALSRGKGEFLNGSRLVYPMEGRAMRFLNLVANKFFALLFSWVLGQQVRDTLCGTKVLYRADYERIAANRSFFGDFDPFGDFDLLFGAARLNLKIVDLPIRYHERLYGETNISRFSHGWLLLQMSAFAARKLKFL